MQGNRFEAFAPAVVQVARAVQYLKSRKLAEHDLKGTNAMCLCEIEMSGEVGLSAAELSRTCDIDKAQVSRCISELTELGYIFRDDQEGRRYKQKYHLTDAGRVAALDIQSSIEQVRKITRKGLTATEMDEFYRVLTKICDNFSDFLKNEDQNA